MRVGCDDWIMGRDARIHFAVAAIQNRARDHADGRRIDGDPDYVRPPPAGQLPPFVVAVGDRLRVSVPSR